MIEQILVPLDGSPIGETVLPWVRDLARTAGATICLLRVVPPPDVVVTGYENFAPVPVPLITPQEQAAELRRARRYLLRVARVVGSATEVRRLVREGRPAAEIVQAARELGGGALIAMSTHGRTGLGRLVLGSVADEVIRTAGLPVLVLRPDEEALATVRSVSGTG